MPNPTLQAVHVDVPLTIMSTAYLQKLDNYICGKLFPIIPSDKASDLYYTYTKGDWFRDEAAPRGVSSESAGGGYNLGTASFNCVTYAFHKDIDDKIRANSDNPLSPDRDTTQFVTQRMILRQELDMLSKFFTTGKWGTDITPAHLWSDKATSDPIEDIETGKQTILTQTGYLPNKLTLSYDVYRVLKNHPLIVDRMKYTTGPSEQVKCRKILAALCELDDVLVAQAVYNSAAESAAVVMGFAAGSGALLTYSPETPGIMVPSAGYTFMWKGVSQGLGTNIGIKRFRMEWLNSDRVEGEVSFDNRLIGSDLGYFFNNPV
jgi:hypothetical protein